MSQPPPASLPPSLAEVMVTPPPLGYRDPALQDTDGAAERPRGSHSVNQSLCLLLHEKQE